MKDITTSGFGRRILPTFIAADDVTI